MLEQRSVQEMELKNACHFHLNALNQAIKPKSLSAFCPHRCDLILDRNSVTLLSWPIIQ